ncbi:hypothetical protein D3C72_2430280 [compost metagenome]
MSCVGVNRAPAITSNKRAPVWPMPHSIPIVTGKPAFAINSGRCVDVPFETNVISAINAA